MPSVRAGRAVPRGRWISAIAVVCVLGWAVPPLLMLDRGFAIEDEGTYLLSYRFWDSNPYFVTGSQYVYGPLFEALGESIPLLRLVRLLLTLASNAGFACAFVYWLDRRGDVPLPSSRRSLVLLITAAGGMSYLWEPLTPGYYDLTGDLCLALVALMLVALVHAPRVPVWNPLVSGFLGVALLVDKWTACLVLIVVGIATFWGLLRHGRRAAGRYAALAFVGAVLALGVMQVFAVDLGRFVSVMRHVSHLTAVASHSMGYLARMNLSSTFAVLVGAVVLATPLLASLFASVKLARSGRLHAARVWLVSGGVVSALVVPVALGWHGGDVRGRVMVGIAFGGLITTVAAAGCSRQSLFPALVEIRLVVLVLFLVPWLQAAGTNVPLPYLAAECLAMWMGLALMLVSNTKRFPVGAHAVLVALVVVVVATALIAGTTTLMTPFKTSGFRRDDTRVAGLGLRVPAAIAGQYSALSRALAPYVTRGETPMISLDKRAGLVYMLGGVPAGSTWTDAVSPTRTAGILALACRNGDVKHGPPVLLIDRPIDPHLSLAMRGCGFPYPQSFRRLAVPGGPPGLQVYVPRAK